MPLILERLREYNIPAIQATYAHARVVHHNSAPQYQFDEKELHVKTLPLLG